MKRIAYYLLASLLCFGTIACDDSNNDNGGNNGGNNNGGNNNGGGNNNSGSYDVSAKNACEYLVPLSGTSFFEFNFDPEEATAEQTKKAVELCVQEMNGLPSCKDEFIKESSCGYAIQTGKLSVKEMQDAMDKCDENDEECMDAAFALYPCNDSDAAADKCWNDLNDNDPDAADALDDYIQNYRSKYENL